VAGGQTWALPIYLVVDVFNMNINHRTGDNKLGSTPLSNNGIDSVKPTEGNKIEQSKSKGILSIVDKYPFFFKKEIPINIESILKKYDIVNESNFLQFCNEVEMILSLPVIDIKDFLVINNLLNTKIESTSLIKILRANDLNIIDVDLIKGDNDIAKSNKNNTSEDLLRKLSVGKLFSHKIIHYFTNFYGQKTSCFADYDDTIAHIDGSVLNSVNPHLLQNFFNEYRGSVDVHSLYYMINHFTKKWMAMKHNNIIKNVLIDAINGEKPFFFTNPFVNKSLRRNFLIPYSKEYVYVNILKNNIKRIKGE
jgi:hypothetical protein